MEGSPQILEMSDMRNNDKRTKSSLVSRSSIVLIGANIVLSLVILIMVILVFSGQTSSDDGGSVSQGYSDQRQQSDLTPLDIRFPGYFRTYEEQNILEQSIRRNISVSKTLESANCSIGLDVPRDVPWCNLTPSEEDFHSCCLSRVRYVTPTFRVDIPGTNRTLAVFDKKRQFFRTESCEQLSGCSVCTCLIEEAMYTGVYDTGEIGSDSRYGVAVFRFNGCCKCYSY
ncbi:uncharacterized protein [Argopecten irradians]|uniref:uncharacterized protein isoform X1 n=1 Tax=Argopecten irradians TaxID=31199 RepID=UPI00371262F8